MNANHVESVENTGGVSSAPDVSFDEGKKRGKKPTSMGASLKRTENILGWVYISPMIIGLIVFTAIPLVMSIIAMFYDWNGVTSLFDARSVGFQNFEQVLFKGPNHELYWKAFGNTLKFVVQLPIGMVISLFLALAMNRDMKGVQAFRVIYYIPGVMSIVAVAIVWQNMFNINGYINGILGTKVDWLGSDIGVFLVVNLLLIWKGVGYTTLMFIAGLQSVSTDQIEAAKIDGANSWTILIKITLPALYPIIFYLLVTGLMGAMQMFNEPYILIGGYGTANNAMTTTSFVYYFFGERHLGISSVAAWILAVIIFIITAIQMYVDRKMREDF